MQKERLRMTVGSKSVLYTVIFLFVAVGGGSLLGVLSKRSQENAECGDSAKEQKMSAIYDMLPKGSSDIEILGNGWCRFKLDDQCFMLGMYYEYGVGGVTRTAAMSNTLIPCKDTIQ